MSFEISLLTSS